MILSNEPGYYREGAFGIRIENLIVVQPAPALDGADPERDMYNFLTLTFVPIDRRLILPAMMDAAEIDWLTGITLPAANTCPTTCPTAHALARRRDRTAVTHRSARRPACDSAPLSISRSI